MIGCFLLPRLDVVGSNPIARYQILLLHKD
jgi:hypothetical protein